MLRIIALDPGGTTGWAQYTSPYDGKLHETTCGQIGPAEHHDRLMNLLESQRTDDYVVLCESFEFRQGRQRANINLMSKEYIGVVKLFQQQSEHIVANLTVRFQTAAMAKGFVSDDKIQRLGLWYPGQRHAMDAMRHLLYYIATAKDMHESLIPVRSEMFEAWRA